MSLDDYVFEKPKAPKKGGAKAQASGKSAQELINATNDAYEESGRAYVREVGVKFQIERFGTQGRATGRVQKGPVDYLGSWGGRSIAFDAKSSDNKTSFPLSNVEDHQVTFLRKWTTAGSGIGFLLVRMVAWEKWYVVPFVPFLSAWQEADHGDGPKSLNRKWFNAHALEVPVTKGLIDYLLVVRDFLEVIRG